MNTMQITCDCGERSWHLPFEHGLRVAWHCVMCGRRHLFGQGFFRDWVEITDTKIDGAALVYELGGNGVVLKQGRLREWLGQDPARRIPVPPPPPKPIRCKRSPSLRIPKKFTLPETQWKEGQAYRQRLFRRIHEAAGQGMSLAGFDAKHQLLDKLSLQDEVEAVFAEAAKLRGTRDECAREIRHYQRFPKS